MHVAYFPLVNVVCLDSGHLLHDFLQVTEVNNIDLGRGGDLLFISTFSLLRRGFDEDCSKDLPLQKGFGLWEKEHQEDRKGAGQMISNFGQGSMEGLT